MVKNHQVKLSLVLLLNSFKSLQKMQVMRNAYLHGFYQETVFATAMNVNCIAKKETM